MTETNAAQAAAPAAAVKPAKVEQNGVTRPKAGTQTARIWEISDALSQAAGKPANRGDVLKAATTEGLNEATAATQYGRWCKFFGVKAEPKPKVEKPKKEKAPKAVAPTAAPAAAASEQPAAAPAPAADPAPAPQA